MSSYALGVDLGTTFSAAAIARGGNVEALQLGADAAQIPSVVLLREDGEVLVGDAADRRAALEPARAAREFKRRLGDPVPIVIGGVTQPIESLMAHLLRAIVQKATEREGEPPTLVVLTHPANYTDYKRGALLEAARQAGLDPSRVQLLTEPEAAAVSYSRQNRVEPGEIVAVYDFGGGTFDAALLRRTATRFELIGMPEGMERLGGIDFDQAVLAHVDHSLNGMVSGADRNDPNTLPAQARLRVECRRAKEALSNDSDTTIPVTLPQLNTMVRLTRDEFESMVRPRIAETIGALGRSITSAGLTPDQVSRVLLVGGTSRMPIVSEMVRSATGRPVALDAHPKLAIATGAALVGASGLGAVAPAAGLTPPTMAAPVLGAAAGAAVAGAAPAAPTLAQPTLAAAPPTDSWQAPARVAPPTGPVPTTPARGPRKGLIAAAVGGGVGIAAVAAVLLLGGKDDSSSTATTAGSTPVATESVPVATDSVPVSTDGSTTSTGPTDTTVPTVPARGVDAIVVKWAFGAGAPGGIPGPATSAGVSGITGVATDPAGITYVTTADGQLLRVKSGQVEVVAPVPASAGVPGGLAVADDGSVYLTGADGVWKLSGGSATLVVDAAANGLGNQPGPIALDGPGNVYFADNATHRLIRYGLDGSLNLVAGNGIAATPGPIDGDGQPATAVPLGTLTGIAIDSNGRLLYADATLLAVRAIAPSGVVGTLAGGGVTPLAAGSGVWAPDGTAAADLSLRSVDGLTVDGSGRVYVADSGSGAIFRIAADGTITAIIVRNDQPVADDVTAQQSSVGELGPMACEPSGALLFTDSASLRRIADL